MTKHYKRGKFSNNLKELYSWHLKRCLENTSINYKNETTKFVKTLIVRGIGYRAFALQNDLINCTDFSALFVEHMRPIFSDSCLEDAQELSQIGNFELTSNRYVIVRAGHTRDLRVPLHTLTRCKTSKKDRKLVISSENKLLTANLAKRLHLYRTPSVYTGRGVRVKHLKPARKAGKKDKQKGRAF